MISLKNFKEYKGLLESSITNRAFRSRLMFEAIADENFANDIKHYMKRLEGNISSKELDSILTLTSSFTIKSFKVNFI